MYHSITFNDERNTWDDWHLIPSSRPVFLPPPVRTKYLTIPGSNEVVDLTEVLTGRPMYDPREGSIEFIVDNGHDEWVDIYSSVLNYLHGQKLKAILEDDPAYYYEGRFSVNTWKSDSYYSKITIDYYVHPYKKELASSLEEWLWDPFDFETGIIRDYANLVVDGTLTVKIVGSDMPVTPIITSSSEMTLEVNGKKYSIKSGTNPIYGLTLGSGTYTFVFTGTGTISVEYRGGML